MRYGILADIHGNLEALDAVLAHLHDAGASAYLCLGDIVGYGADPNACCERLRALRAQCVVGNHDLAALGAFDLSWMNPLARAAVEWTAHQLSPENRAFLRSLPEEGDGPGFQFVHGSLVEPTTAYITHSFAARASLELQHAPVCFVGHTHVPALYARRRGGVLVGRLAFAAGQRVVLEPGRQYLANCGAVGQPRDGNPDAACGLFDAGTGTLTRYRVPYDIDTAQAKIRAAGLPFWLAERLTQGA
jgi:diadenosine tetraphosphatase ApaH/serine/threonine PP2A family protein phosphatase